MLERIISCGSKAHREIVALSARAALTSHIDLGGLSHRNSLPTVPKPGNPKSKVLAESAPGEGRLPGLQTAVFFLCPHFAWGRYRRRSSKRHHCRLTQELDPGSQRLRTPALSLE